MLKKLILIIPATILFGTNCSKAQNPALGEKLFKTACSACHSIGKGKVVGPDLKNVATIRKEKWLISWIKSSQTMIKKNDPLAVKLFAEFNKIPMPDQNLTDIQIKDILTYIKQQSPATPAKPTAKPTGNTVKPTKTTSAQVNAAPASKTIATGAGNWVNSDYSISSYGTAKEINPKELYGELWQNILWEKLPVSPQNVTYPNLHHASVDSIMVKSLYNNNQLAFLVQWDDSSRNTDVEIDKFCDQLAIQLPLNKDNIPSYMMGNNGGTVHIVHWKAVWQEDCEKGFQDVQKKYPNMWVDVYPGLENQINQDKKVFAKDISSETIVEAKNTLNMPGTYSNNPMSQIKRKEPVEEANAEGFGTLATLQIQEARGWGKWMNGKWTVCLIVPANNGNINKPVVKDRTKVAFAIWDGGYQNIGGRKHYMPWADLILNK